MATHIVARNRIAERILWLVEAGQRRKVVVVLGRPRRWADSSGYRCEYEIRGLVSGVRYAAGVDGIQAIQLALQKASLDAASAAAKRNAKLEWFEGSADLGLATSLISS